MAEVGRDRWRSSAPTSLLKQSQLQPLAQDYVQTDLLTLSKDGDFTTSLGNLFGAWSPSQKSLFQSWSLAITLSL